MLMRYNQDLNSLVANGRHFFTAGEGEFGAIDKIWNCVALCVMSQIHVNDSLLSTIRNDIVGPFNAAFKEDFKHSELQIESQELLQMVETLDDAEGTYNWNHKAPVILQNFENYKRFEKDTLFNAFIAYLNVVNSRNARLVSKNENAVNFILKEFNIDKEMESYTDYMINTKVEAPPKPKVKNPVEKPAPSKTSSSVASGTSAGSSSGKERRKSKLMLKVGSILGRKKKHGVASHSETIPEDHSVVSATLSRQETQASRAETKNSLYQPPAPVSKLARSNSASHHPAPATIPEDVAGGAKKGNRTLPSLNTQPLVPNNAVEKKLPTPQTPVLAPAPAPVVPEVPRGSDLYAADERAPNVEKLESSDDDSDVPTDKSGNRMSLLKTHDLGNTPKLNADPEEQARGASAGKYSFEYGDEEKSISTPIQTPKLANRGFDLEPESQPPTYDEETAQAVLPEKHELKLEQRPPPPPPPSRKTHNSGIDAKRDFMLPANTSYSHAADGMSLRSQMTGASLLKQDYFKHFDATDDISRPGLNTSIAEIINVSIVRGEVTKSQILGEVAFNYNSQEVSSPVAVKIPLKLSRFLLNEQIMQESEKGVYNLNVAPILGKTLGGIKYSLDIDPQEVPILIKQIWKTEETQASLIVKVMLNPSYGQQIQLDNFVISASLDSSVSSTSASSKPEGSFNKDANRITWRYGKPLVLSAANPEEKLIARIMTNGVGKESSSGVKVKFSVALPQTSFAKIYDLDDNTIPSVINLSSGNYSSHFK